MRIYFVTKGKSHKGNIVDNRNCSYEDITTKLLEEAEECVKDALKLDRDITGNNINRYGYASALAQELLDSLQMSVNGLIKLKKSELIDLSFEVDVHNHKLLIEREFEHDGMLLFDILDRKGGRENG